MAITRISLLKLVDELQQLCQQERTGRLIVTTSNNRFVSFGLKNGRITWINYADKTGSEALDNIATLDSITAFTFMEVSSDTGVIEALPSNEEIFRQLGASTLSSLTDSAPTARTINGISSEHRLIIEQTLAAHIGPMAKIVCNKVFRLTNDLHSAIEEITDNIPNQEHASVFRDEIRAKLQ